MRLIFIILLFILTHFHCSAQSWDWMIGTTNSFSWSKVWVNEAGESIVFSNKDRILNSTTDSAYYSGEELTRFDVNAKRICGLTLGLNDKLSRIAAVTELKDKVYIILSTRESITIDGKHYPATNHNYLKIILIVTDKQFKIIKSESLGGALFQLLQIQSILVDAKEDIYLSGSFRSIDLRNSVGSSGNYSVKYQSVFIAKISSVAELIWFREFDGAGGNTYASNLRFDSQNNLRFSKLFPRTTLHHLDAMDGKDLTPFLIIYGDTRFNLDGFWTDEKDRVYILGEYKVIALQDGSFSSSSKDYAPFLLIFSPSHKLLQKIYEADEHRINLRTVITDTAGRIYLSGRRHNKNNDSSRLAGNKISTNPKESQFFLRLDNVLKGEWLDYAKTTHDNMGFQIQTFKDNCNNIYFYSMFDQFSGGGDTDLIYNNLGSHRVAGKMENGYYLAKLNPDKLEYRLEEKCDGYYLINESDTAKYTSFMWTLPGGITQKSTHAVLPKKYYKDSVYVSLTGYKPGGCQNTITKRLKPAFLPVPEVSFSTDSFSGCQWVGKKFYANIKTENQIDSTAKFIWQFGDGTTSNIKNPVHVYTKSGHYKVKLWYYNGYCSDSFISGQNITIIDAPKPGFSLSDTVLCAAGTLKIKDHSEGQVSSYFYDLGNGETTNVGSPEKTYNIPGKYLIRQKLTGPTGCITEDSAWIRVRRGWAQNQSPEMLTATVEQDSHVLINWKKDAISASFILSRSTAGKPMQQLALLNDTFYLDKDVNVHKYAYTYQLQAADSCDNRGSTAKLRTILLEKNNLKTTDNMYWSAFEGWQDGVLHYQLEMSGISEFTPVANLNGSILKYSFTPIPEVTGDYRCYRVSASENNGNGQQSMSNTVCFQDGPHLWIPNSFSPGNDSLNEVFIPKFTGIEKLTITIYNRWGERVFQTEKQDEGWNGKYKGQPAPVDCYLYNISAKGKNGENIYKSGLLYLLK